jgi:flagellar hook-associated protein 2
VLSKEGLLDQLQASVQAVATALGSLGTVASGQALSASSSNSSVVSAADSGATAPATYTINSVTYLAAATSETSLSSYADSTTTPVSPTGNMELVVGSQTYPITLTSATNNLNGLAATIDSLGAGVTASVLTTSGADYLSVSANATGGKNAPGHWGSFSSPANPSGTTQFLTALNQGSDTTFQLNGITIHQPSNTVNNVIPGITFNLLGTTNTPVTLSLASDPTQLTSALQTFVTDYNGLRTALNAQEGPSAGALGGDTSILQLENAMRRLTAYTSLSSGSPNSGSLQSLSDLASPSPATVRPASIPVLSAVSVIPNSRARSPS